MMLNQNRLISTLFLFTFIVTSSAFSQTIPVSDTGQTKCFNSDNSIITCPSPGQLFYGQDANYSINPPSFTKRDKGVVRDNFTGLMWEVKSNKDGKSDYTNPNDADNTYTWCDTNQLSFGTCGENDTMDFIAELNKKRHGCYSDWRIPNVEELRSIANYGRYNPAIDTMFFPNTATPSYSVSFYWSSDTRVKQYDTGSAWIVDFNHGDIRTYTKSNREYVRAVRGGHIPTTRRYIDHGDGTVTDTVTGLMWQKDSADTDRNGTPDTMNWGTAISYCENISLAGYTDWRMPNIKELSSLVDRSRYDPAVNIAFFPKTRAHSFYWASTPSAGAWGEWHISFRGGEDFAFIKSFAGYVRAVRKGQATPKPPPEPPICPSVYPSILFLLSGKE